jgi:MoCo/4Fe-4S cofactor protein with predicted Tat translocation signal
MTTSSKLDLNALRAKLSASQGPRYWRSLEELAETPEFAAFVEDEFPSRAEEWKSGIDRRNMLRLMAASFSLAGLTACTKQPQEIIMPYVRQPEDVVLGHSLYFATAMPFRGSGVGLLVESREGRPVKIEGNPQHPSSLGGTFVQHQAATLDLYDPDRSQASLFHGRITSWGKFIGEIAERKKAMGTGEGFHILSRPIISPTLAFQRQQLQQMYPALRWHEYDPVAHESSIEGARQAFTQPVHPIHVIDRADVIVSLDSDFLYESIPNARGFASRRHAEADRSRMNRLYVFEPTPTVTGAKSDHRLPVKAVDIEDVARAIAAQTGAGGTAPQLQPDQARMVNAVSRDLQAHRGTSLVIAGEQQTPAVHALAHAINQALGNSGATVLYADYPDAPAPGGLRTLSSEMRAGRVKTLLLLSVNPVYDAPADLEFEKQLDNVPFRIHLGLHQDETAARCHWHIPEAHFLESWGDVVAHDGTVSIIQPLIAPLYDGRTPYEILASFTDNPDQSGYRIVKGYWQSQYGGADFEAAWKRWLHDGFIPNTQYEPRSITAKTALPPRAATTAAGGLEIVFRPDPCVWDGSFSNNGWLQETPKPHTKLTWDNAIYISPATAQRLDVQNEDVVELEHRGRKVQGPAWIVPGQANDSITVFLGYGRTRGGRVASTGFNASVIRTSDAPAFGAGAQLRKTGRTSELACTQKHHAMEGRDIVRVAGNQQYIANPKLFAGHGEDLESAFSLYPEWNYSTNYRWGMAIDQNACIGCNACMVACVAENNIPVVGKDQVIRQREMHWIRVDSYFSESVDNPETHFQPVPCMHCEKAPCEPVCPVAATVHSGDGLNQMIYNRCVGTRYCSNNCPYKVRRFNFYLYPDWDTPTLELLRNPEVTVRSRGVMEKCTYCVQRIEAAKIEAEKEARPLREGDIVTACQQACPTEAILFGDLNDNQSRVYRLRHSALNYSLLPELGTQPRTTYLAKLTNRNPELENKA